MFRPYANESWVTVRFRRGFNLARSQDFVKTLFFVKNCPSPCAKFIYFLQLSAFNSSVFTLSLGISGPISLLLYPSGSLKPDCWNDYSETDRSRSKNKGKLRERATKGLFFLGRLAAVKEYQTIDSGSRCHRRKFTPLVRWVRFHFPLDPAGSNGNENTVRFSCIFTRLISYMTCMLLHKPRIVNNYVRYRARRPYPETTAFSVFSSFPPCGHDRGRGDVITF